MLKNNVLFDIFIDVEILCWCVIDNFMVFGFGYYGVVVERVGEWFKFNWCEEGFC